MSMTSSGIICNGCDYTAREVYRPRRVVYQTVCGQSIEAWFDKGWCYQCAGWSDLECLTPALLASEVSGIEREQQAIRKQLKILSRGWLAGLRHHSRRKQLQQTMAGLEPQREKLVALLDIAQRRQSQPRCLNCGSDQTEAVSFDDSTGVAQEFQHACGGRLQKVYGQGPDLRFSYPVVTHVLNEEGDLLAME